MEAYRTVKKGKVYTGEITEKKSRFIGSLIFTENETEALDFLDSVRKQHFKAKHNCSAYIIGNGAGLPDKEHSSDDGEPQGTAGKPILAVIKGEELKNVMLVVTRYFGGVLLGTGGLVRAYTDASKEAVKAAELQEIRPFINVDFSFDYAKEGAVRRFLENHTVSSFETAYSDRVSFSMAVDKDEIEAFKKGLTSVLSGLSAFNEGSEVMLPADIIA